MNLNPEATVPDDIIMWREPNTLYEPVICEHLKEIRVSHAMFKVTSCVGFGPYLKSFNSLERYVRWLEEQIIDQVKNPNHMCMEQSLSMVTDLTLPLGVGVSAHIKVHFNLILCFYKPSKRFYMLAIFHNMFLKFLNALDHQQNHPASIDDAETTTLRIPASQHCS